MTRPIVRTLRPKGLRIPAAFVLALALALGASQPAAAQQADPRVEAWLHHGIAAVHTASPTAPRVRLLDADGNLRAEGRVGAVGAEGRWPVDFNPDAALDFERPRILIRPGDHVEVELAGQTFQHRVPDLVASAYPERGTVEGRAPAGTTFLAVLAHRDPAWFEAPHDFPIQTRLAPAGDFVFDLSGVAPIGPGYWAEVAAVDAAGHLTVLQIAPPSITLADSQAFAILRADAGLAPRLTTRSRIGTELFRSAPAYALGGVIYAVLLAPDGNPDFGIYQPEEGERIQLLLGEDPETEPALDEVLPRALASIDPRTTSVWGLAPAGARISIDLARRPGASQSALSTVDDSGRFAVDLASGGSIPDGAEASIQVYPGGALARVARALVPVLEIPFYGAQLGGSIPGWGDMQVELLDAEGQRLARLSSTADLLGRIQVDLRDRQGQPLRIEPGQQLRIDPELGRALDLIIPPLRVEVDAVGGLLRGQGPPDGARLRATAYQREASIFDFAPYTAEAIDFEGRIEPSGDGSFQLACPEPDCLLSYGRLGLRTPEARFELPWLEAPIVGLGVSDRVANGRATAGLDLSITARDAAGAQLGMLAGRSVPLAADSLPGWNLPLSDLYPEGMASGDRVEIGIGQDAPIALTIPDFDWQADVAADRVAGRAPPGRLVAVVAFARGELDQRPDASVATGLVGLGGRWQAEFADFDLRAGDDLEIYLFEAAGRFLWWSEDAIPGPDPSPTSPVPTASPTPTASPVAPSREIYLPRLQRP